MEFSAVRLQRLRVLWMMMMMLAVDMTCGQRLVGSVNNVYNVGLLNLFIHSSGGPQTTYSVLASTYDTGRGTYDNAFVLYHPGLAMSSGFAGYTPNVIYNQLYWPKEISQVPSQVFNFDAVAIPDGSSIFGKTTGSVYISDVDDFEEPSTSNILLGLLPMTDNYAYANMAWLQADSGFSWDIVTCRVLIENDAVKQAQLVWLEQPAVAPMSSQWTVKVLKESACDTNVDVASFSAGGDSYEVVYTTGLYLRRLAFFYTSARSWTDPDDIVGTVIEQGREFYDVKLVDINNDGRKDILTTVIDRFNGTVEVWEVPSDFRNGNEYVRHVIASGFASRSGTGTGRAPGVARAFMPNSASQQKPWIALSGGDDGRAYVLRPKSPDANNWEYTQTQIADYGQFQMVAGIAAADVDADGYPEVFVSARNLNVVNVYSYSPSKDD